VQALLASQAKPDLQRSLINPDLIFDPFLRAVDASQNDEARDAIIGMDKQWNLLFVVHLLIEENDVIRNCASLNKIKLMISLSS
jgi:hypothetical protein